MEFIFKPGKSFFDYHSHPITIPRSQVEYVKFLQQGLVSENVRVIFPNGRQLSGRIRHSQSGWGEYYQIMMYGYENDCSNSLVYHNAYKISICKQGPTVLVKISPFGIEIDKPQTR